MHTLHHCDTLFLYLASMSVWVSNLVLQVHLAHAFTAVCCEFHLKSFENWTTVAYRSDPCPPIKMRNALKSMTQLIHHTFSFSAHTVVIRNHRSVEKVTILTAICVLRENMSELPGSLTGDLRWSQHLISFFPFLKLC